MSSSGIAQLISFGITIETPRSTIPVKDCIRIRVSDLGLGGQGAEVLSHKWNYLGLTEPMKFTLKY
jgi:hypothetical protein